ncbi:MAG: PilZ domain-containing protein, partial [Desulfobacteraceae bacterium]|nr:PilZ domain-containing protein [Desulfobacteraceae bacterium]
MLLKKILLLQNYSLGNPIFNCLFLFFIFVKGEKIYPFYPPKYPPTFAKVPFYTYNYSKRTRLIAFMWAPGDKMQTSHERREHERFVPKDSAFVVFRPQFSKIGPIEDISRGGLRCKYLPPADEKTPAAETSHLIDIFISNNGFHLTNIPCSLIYDVENDQLSFMPDLMARQCGLKFDQLTEKQEKQINHFLVKHTAG